jgi:hypothetical protein
MPNAPSWIVCETSGRWTAALRVAIARQELKHSNRIQEVRSLPELAVAAKETPSAMALLEVDPANLAASLNWFSLGWERGLRAAALLGTELVPNQATEAMLEAGALTMIESPRHMAAVLGLAGRFAVSRSKHAKKTSSAETIAERAWASLPWQDA